MLNAGFGSTLTGLDGAVRSGTGMLASFDSTAPDVAMPKNVAHKAMTPKSTAQRYFRSRVSTVGPTQEQHRGHKGRASNPAISTT